MRGTYTETRRSPAGEGAATDQVADDTRGNGAPRVDTKTGDAPGLDKPGANGTSEDALAAILTASENGNVPEGTGPTARTDTINAVLAILLADHPEAVFYAIDANVVTVPMPDSVNLNGHTVIKGHHSGLEMVIPGHRGVVIDTWEKAQKTGVATGHVRLAADPERHVMLTFLDARAQHGVYLGIFTADEQTDHADEQAAITPEMPERAPRFARARKDGLAVLLEIDEAFTQILGWEPEEVLGLRSRDLVHPDDEALAVDNWMNMLASSGPARRVRLRHHHRDGSWVWMEVTNHNLLEDPEHQCVVAEMVDISEEMATHEALRAREQLLDRLAETLPLGLLQVDSDSRVIYTNDRLHYILGTARASSVEEQLSTVVDEDSRSVAEAFAGVLSNGLDSDIEIRVRPLGESDKQLRYCALNLRTLTDASGGVTGAIVCVADVTETARAREELRARATFDAVTRCYNRASAMAELEAMLAPDGTGQRPAVIFIDLDHFKDVNDNLGHIAGDEFLRVVAQRLHRCVRAEDVVGRIGGDEFLVICPHISATAEAMRTAARLAHSLRNQIVLKKAAVPSSASIGVAWCDAQSTTAEALVAQADAAMYQSKRAGNGEPVLFNESMPGAEGQGDWQWPAPPDERT
ncbi:MAG: sensor domain-containing diguanylate cyclase [Acidimicrobiales bacterium]|jgi:diguanylate cyclase (GGDEF)-like protein/PAS domain S-box-containing protein